VDIRSEEGASNDYFASSNKSGDFLQCLYDVFIIESLIRIYSGTKCYMIRIYAGV